MLSFYDPTKLVAGCDEAGRGCLAGPVFAASVILPPDFKSELLDDSKKLNEKTRLALEVQIKAEASTWSVARCSPTEIDKLNILWASVKAMQKAVDKLKLKPDVLLIDGNRFKPHKNYHHECIIKGDGIYYSIAAASILAKTARDRYMKNLSKKHPDYLWHQNKGYPTKAHRSAIKAIGSTKYHRKSFRLLPYDPQGNLF